MNTVDENPYAPPTAQELPTPPKVSVEQPRLGAFLLQGLYAALMTAPLNAMSCGAIQFTGRKVAVSFYGNAALSFVAVGIEAVGDGLTAMLCWSLVKNQPRSLTVFAAGAGSRILAILCQGVLAIGMDWDFSAIPQFMLYGLIYGVPSLFLTLIFLRMLNRRASFWFYPTVFIAAPVAVYMLDATVCVIGEAASNLLGTPGMVTAICAETTREGLYLCILAATLWFSVRASEPAVTQSSSPL